MTSNHHALYDLGYTRTTMALNKEKQDREVEQNSEKRPSSDCRLQLACTKSELLVIVDQREALETKMEELMERWEYLSEKQQAIEDLKKGKSR